jgi:hypothetical protein
VPAVAATTSAAASASVPFAAASALPATYAHDILAALAVDRATEIAAPPTGVCVCV